MKYTLGIDQGTTQTTAVVVDENGSFVEKNSVPLPARFPNPGWVEQDPFDIVRTVKEAVSPLIDKYEIAAVGFDNPGETFIVWDGETGQPVTPATVWHDTPGVSALGNSLDELSSKWKMDAVEEERKLSQWRKAVAATQMFHDETKL